MQLDQNHKPFWKRHLDQIGVVGLGFLVNDAVLIPLLVLFLSVTLWGLYLGKRHHGSWMPF